MISQTASRFGATPLALTIVALSPALAQSRATPNDALRSTEVSGEHKTCFGSAPS
jgi:hypothetical protein